MLEYGLTRVAAVYSQAPTESNNAAVPVEIADTRSATSSSGEKTGRDAASSTLISSAADCGLFANSVANIRPVTPPPTTTIR